MGTHPRRRFRWEDASIEELSAAAREELAAFWVRRAVGEWQVGRILAELRDLLASVGAPPAVRALTLGAPAEEGRHGAWCLRLARLYAGRPLARPVVPAAVLPGFWGAEARLRAVYGVTVVSCIHETIATTWLLRCFQRCTAPLPRGILRAMLQDETGHARIGWAYLASPGVTPEDRMALRRRLPKLLGDNVAAWRPRPFVHGPPDGQGVLCPAEHVDVVRTAVAEIVLPGFAEIGIVSARETARLSAVLTEVG